MRFLIFCAATFFAVAATALPPTPTTTTSAYAELEVPQITIVMEDAIMMLVATDGTVGKITEITVAPFNGQVEFQLNGCGDASCRVNLSSLSSGTYYVQVKTSSGQTFFGSVTVGI
ncbi:MAG: hypothetical protein AAFP77_01985 [Bacteroidota bacterium]